MMAPMMALPRLALLLALLAPGVAHAADKAMEAYTAGAYARAYKLWRPRADKGEREAQFNIGSLYEHGQGVALDAVKATDWYRKAASRGHEVAQFNLGNMYGDGTRRAARPDARDAMAAQFSQSRLRTRSVQPRHEISS